MTFLEKLRVIERVDQLVRMKATGTSTQLAERLGCSRSTVFEILDCMKSMGAEIKFCKYKKSYYYSAEKVLSIGFVSKKQAVGGRKYFPSFFGSDFFGLSALSFASES